MRARPVWILIILLILTGCRVSNRLDTASLLITLPDAKRAIGQTTLTVIVQTPDGTPIDNATVEITGDMTHAGMAPVFGKVQGGKEGRYSVPFDWNMGGDWVLTIKATLPDGTSAKIEQKYTL